MTYYIYFIQTIYEKQLLDGYMTLISHLTSTTSGFMWLSGFMCYSGFMWYSSFKWLYVAKSVEKWGKVAKSS